MRKMSQWTTILIALVGATMAAMDSAADKCLPDEVAKTPEEEATG